MMNHQLNTLYRASVTRMSPVLLALLATVVVGCGEPANQSRAAFVLIDISSQYAGERQKAQLLTNYLLAELNSGDSLAVGFIDNTSFSERNIIARATFDHRPSVASQEKRAFKAELEDFMERFRVPSYHSDVTGGVLLATDYLRSVEAGHRHLFILSDLHEDVPPGINRNIEVQLDDIDVVAMNVRRQRSDNDNPEQYRERLAEWQQQVKSSGGRWEVVNDMGRLEHAVTLR